MYLASTCHYVLYTLYFVWFDVNKTKIKIDNSNCLLYLFNQKNAVTAYSNQCGISSFPQEKECIIDIFKSIFYAIKFGFYVATDY